MKIQAFTHTDLDGVVSNLLFCKYFEFLGYKHNSEKGYSGEDIDKRIKAYLDSDEYSKDDIIIITDVCPSYAMAERLDKLPNKKVLVDHHETSRISLSTKDPNIIDFDWAEIEEGDSATMMVYKKIEKKLKDYIESPPTNSVEDLDKVVFIDFLESFKAYRPLVIATDLWDTKPRNDENFLAWRTVMEDLLNLLSSMDLWVFRDRFMSNPSVQFTDVERATIDTIANIKDKIIKATQVYYRPVKYKGKSFLCAVCFCGIYRSELAEYIAKNNSEVLYLVMFDMNGCRLSFRRGNTNDSQDLDLTKIAKQLDPNAGGHPFACGGAFELMEFGEVLSRVMNVDYVIE